MPYGWFTEDYAPLEYATARARLQVAVSDIGLISDVSITPSVPSSEDPRPRLCQYVFQPGIAIKGDGRLVGWEWWADARETYIIDYKVDGVAKSITVPALPERQSADVIPETIHAAGVHPGAWMVQRVVRLDGEYPNGGYVVDGINESTSLFAAHCDDYVVYLRDGNLRLHQISTGLEVAPGTPVHTEVHLLMIQNQL